MCSTWNVITAGPSAGKSSTIRELSSRGYRTLPEAARILLDQRISEGDDPKEVRSENDFHEQVEEVDRFIESNLDNETYFLDRSLADNIAYRHHFGNPIPETLKQECRSRYDNIFLLERLDFEDDNVRSEDENEAKLIHSQIENTYEELGYNVIHIDLMPVRQRADLIEDYIP